jgi:site-specific DNA recombinase
MSPEGSDVRTCVIYVRQSMDRDALEEAVGRQQEDGEELAALRGLKVLRVYCDNDRSARAGKVRPEFEKMLKAVEAGEPDVVIGWNMYRLLRTGRDKLRLIEACREHSVDICLVRGSDMNMSTPAGRLAAGILGEVAQHEIDEKGDRQKRANEQAAQKGKPAGRRAFGFEGDGITLRAKEAVAIGAGYRAYLAGTSLSAIARDWNAAGFAAQSRPWHHDSVRAVLRNPRYKGVRRYGPTGEEFPARWPQVVDAGTWDAVNDLLKARQGHARPAGPRALLTGEALCGICGRTVHAGGATHRYRTYRCISGSHVARRAAPVDEYVSLYAVARLSRPDARGLMTGRGNPEFPALRAERAALAARMDTAARDWAGLGITDARLRMVNRELGARIAEIDTRLADAARAGILSPLLEAADIRAAWDGLGTDHQRSVIGLLMTVRLYPPGRGVTRLRPETIVIEPKK